jgi:hypothetical protein
MAINFNISNPETNVNRTITVDFVSDFLASEKLGVSDVPQYFFRFNTTARDIDNQIISVKIAKSFSDLVLNGEKQRINDTNSSYTSIKELLLDYIYDYIKGHEENQWGTTVKEQKKIKI